VDASGSAALQRLSEAKGAVEQVLADCYVRRDQVALVAFRATTAELLVPPTRWHPASTRRSRLRSTPAVVGGPRSWS
jgi:magnesium chelatase subunit D